MLVYTLQGKKIYKCTKLHELEVLINLHEILQNTIAVLPLNHKFKGYSAKLH